MRSATETVKAMLDREADLADSWEYWHQKARKYENALYAIRAGLEDRRVQLTSAEIHEMIDEVLA